MMMMMMMMMMIIIIWRFLFCSFGSYGPEVGHANFSEIAGKCAEKRRGDVPKTYRKRTENEPRACRKRAGNVLESGNWHGGQG